MRIVALMIFLIMITSTLAGCTGDNNEINSANDRIAELESQNDANQNLIAELGSQNEANQNLVAELESEAMSDDELYQKLMNDFSDQSTLINQLQNNCCTWDDMYQQLDEGYAMGVADATPVSTLDIIADRGHMKCGVKSNQYGMAYLDSISGNWSGLDISYCRAVAAAIGLNPDTDIEYVPASGSDRFEKLSSGTIDVLIRTTTWTTSRDAALNSDYAGINFYDGQGILVNSENFPNATSSLDLDGATICVAESSTSAGNIADYFYENNMDYVAVNSWSDGDDFRNELCDAVTGDISSLVAMKWQYEQDDSLDFDMNIMQEVISKEPLAAVTRDYDSDWNEVVSWVWYAMITAEEMGVSSTNYASADSSNPAVERLLYSNLGLGTDNNPLSDNWMQNVLATVGNYGEAYDRAFCDGNYDGVSGSDAMNGCLIHRSGTFNALVSEGGLQYSPPMR
jgi:general L-amino acid transport system substrate-binding protein